MKLCKFALGVVALAVSASSLAGMVTTSSNLEFLAINGQKASKSLLKEKKSFNAEADQTQQVVVRLGEIVGTGVSVGACVTSGVGVSVTSTVSVLSVLPSPPKLHAVIKTDADIAIAEIASNLLFLIVASLIWLSL